MKTQIKQPQPVSHTIQSKTKAANQAPLQKILQRYAITQREALTEEDELLQGKFETAQREELEEDELLQGKFETTQREALPEEDELLQGKFETIERKTENNTGMPDNLKSGIENMSGFSMDNVRVHYNSSKPAQLQALAYTKGTDIHVAPGQEKHLPHEAWHVVQQMQGRVQPTMQLQGVNVNNNEGLEKEADVMGGRAKNSLLDRPLKSIHSSVKNIPPIGLSKTAQRVGDKFDMEQKNNVSFPKLVQNRKESLFEIYENYKKKKKEERVTSRQLFDNAKGLKLKHDIESGVLKTTDKAAKRHEIADPKIEEYEHGQIAGATNLEELIEQMKKSCNKDGVTWIDPDITQEIFDIKVQYESSVHNVLTVYKENERFSSADSSGIYKKKSNIHKEYVKAWNDTFVPRYIYRYLSKLDKNGITYDPQNRGIITSVGDLPIDRRNPISLDPTLAPSNQGATLEKIGPPDEEIKTLDKLFSLNEEDEIKVDNTKISKNNKNKTIRWYLHHAMAPNDIAAKIQELDKTPFFLQEKHKINIGKINSNIQDEKKNDLFNFLKKSDSEGCYWESYNSNLKADKGITKKEVLSHQRSKEQQGGSGFVSCTATKHPIFGSTGQDFYEDSKSQMNVVAKIDLSKIDANKIIHTYSKKNMQELYGIKAPDTTKKFNQRKGNESGYESNAAARDAMRTREIVINGKIPSSAIIEVEYSPKESEECLFRDYGSYLEE